MINQSETMDKLFQAVCKMQSEILGAKKGSKGHNYNYADLTECWDALREPLTKNGLCVIQTYAHSEVGVKIVTTLGHASGQFITGAFDMPCSDIKKPQLMGTVSTYNRRYSLMSICGLSPIDLDANDAIPDEKKKAQSNLTNMQIAILKETREKYSFDKDDLIKYVKEKYNKTVPMLTTVEYNELLDIIIVGDK